MNTIKKIHAIKAIKDLITAKTRDMTQEETLAICTEIYEILQRRA